MPKVTDEVKILNQVLSLLKPMDEQKRARLLATVAMFFGASLQQPRSPAPGREEQSSGSSVTNREDRLSPKEFLRQKGATAGVERIACLAYFLTHHRDMSDFKTRDLTDLNVEARAGVMSNPAVYVQNTTRAGYLNPMSGGRKQLSDFGEQFVEALPDREAANALKSNSRRQRRRKRVKAKS
jgi:hypothetical protein